MTGRAWPFRLAAREGVATARAGRWTSVLVIATVAWLTCAPGVADALSVSRLVERENQWVRDGAFVYLVTGLKGLQQNTPIPVVACEGLARIEGIDGAFAARAAEGAGSLAQAPASRIPVFEVSAGATTFLGAPAAGEGVAMISDTTAARTGIRDGEPIVVTRTASVGAPAARSGVLTARVVATKQIGAGYDGALLLPQVLGDAADTCVVRTDAAHATAVVAMLPSALSWDGRPAVVASRMVEGDYQVTFKGEYGGRALRWVWVASAILLALFWAMIQWFRRSHAAIYTTFGMPPSSRLVMQVAEWGVLGSAGAAWGWALGVSWSIALGARGTQAVAQLTWHTLLTMLAATALVALLGLRPTGSLLSDLKDR